MRRLVLALAAALALPPPAAAVPVRPVAPVVRRPPLVRPLLRRRRFFFPPFFRVPRPRLRPPPLLLPSPPGELVVPPPIGSPPLQGEPNGLPAFAHGFHLTVPVGGKATFKVPPTLARYVDVGQALGACFAPPADIGWGSITLRVSFKRDGSVFGDPRIPFSDAGTAEQKSALARSLMAALKRCTPLHLSPSLGGAIAGEIFAIRFVNQDRP